MIKIRAAAVPDQKNLFALVARIANFNAEEKELAREVIGDALASPASGYSILLAVGNDGGLAGFICFGPIPITIKRWDLYWIAVDPDCARQGIGSLLVQAMEKELGPGGRVYIDTSSTGGYESARLFYERQGYEPVCFLPDFYRPGDD